MGWSVCCVACAVLAGCCVATVREVNTAENPCNQVSREAFVDDCFKEVRLEVDNPINITSPGFPCSFPRSFSCQWNLQAPKSFLIEMHFLLFDLPESGMDRNCHQAYLEFGPYDGEYRRVSDTERRCGSHSPKRIISPKNSYWISLTSHWYPGNITYAGISVNIQLSSKNKGQTESNPTLVALCAFLVPLFCSLPLYHCFQRMAVINKRKRVLANIQGIRSMEMRERARSVALNREIITRTMSVGRGASVSSVFFTITEEPEEPITDRPDGSAVPPQKDKDESDKNNNLSIAKAKMSKKACSPRKKIWHIS